MLAQKHTGTKLHVIPQLSEHSHPKRSDMSGIESIYPSACAKAAFQIHQLSLQWLHTLSSVSYNVVTLRRMHCFYVSQSLHFISCSFNYSSHVCCHSASGGKPKKCQDQQADKSDSCTFRINIHQTPKTLMSFLFPSADSSPNPADRRRVILFRKFLRLKFTMLNSGKSSDHPLEMLVKRE